ncbi:hypothetical protein AB0957_00435 [Streptomyces zhihengii]|uniref:hypothetical protein n=1 Tax=Streptomyces zhihengii TaxID=1818004 RepID=UPI003455FCF1
MTRRALPRSTWAITLTLTGAVLAAFVGLRVFGNLVDFTDDHRVPLSGQQRQLMADLEEFRADDGMFVAAVGSAARPGLYESAHGLLALQSMTGHKVLVRTRHEMLRKDFAAEMRREPFSSLLWLSDIEKATGRTIHDREDAGALMEHFVAEGFFRDPGAGTDDVSARLHDTAGALEALDRFGAKLPQERRAAVRKWLGTADAEAPDAPVQIYHAVRIAALTGAEVPRDAAGRSRLWWQSTGSEVASPRTEEDVVEAAYYVLLADELNLDVAGQRERLRAILDPGEPVSNDPQVSSLIARAWTRLDGPPAELEPIEDRIRSRQLPSGLVSSVQQRQGSLTSTYEVAKLRMIAALPSSDPRLRDALGAVRQTVMAEGDPLLSGAWLFLMDATGAEVRATDRRRVVAAVKAAAPRAVEARNVDVWNRYTELLLSIDEPVPAVSLTEWQPTSAQHRYARSLLINGLDRAEQLDRLTHRPRPGELVSEAEGRLRDGTVREAAEALHAASALGWTPTDDDAERITALLEKRRDCPGASAFYRDSAGDGECGVPGTRAAYRISALLEGAVPAITRNP